MLAALYDRDQTGAVQRAEVFGDGRLRHLHAHNDLVDGVLVSVREHGNDLAATRFGDRSEDVGRVCLASHEGFCIFRIRNTSRNNSTVSKKLVGGV